MWVGFLYTVIGSLPSASGLTMASRKGMAPSSLLSSTETKWGGQHLMCWRKLCLFSSLWTTQVSFAYLSHILRGGWQCLEFFLKVFHIKVSYYGAYQGPHSCTFYLFIALILEREVSVFWGRIPVRELCPVPLSLFFSLEYYLFPVDP